MKTAIIGLPMVGKTSLFTILTGVHEAARVGSLEARVGVAKVPDTRLDALAELFQPPKITHATVEYLDFPAISKEALRDQSYLASMRVADALAHVLRLFPSDTVPHEKGSVDPIRDREFALLERCKSTLEANAALRTLELSADEEKTIRGFQFLSQKPMLYVLNIGEADVSRMHEIEEEYRKGPLAGRANTAVSAICGQ